MLIVYRIAIFIYQIAVRMIAIFDRKARLFIDGRRNLLDNISKANIAVHEPVWFHCASLGEFEQARPLIDALHRDGHKVLLTFFSPSGYEIRKNYEHTDWVFYLPMDNVNTANNFIAYTNPKLAIFVKYDLWFYYLRRLQMEHVPSFLISATYRPHQLYFKPIVGAVQRKMLRMFDHIYVQNKSSKLLLAEIGITQSSVVGDTRVDSVMERVGSVERLFSIEQFLSGKKAIVVGSAYVKETEILNTCMSHFKDEKIIIAPHDVSEANVTNIQATLSVQNIRYSKIKDLKLTDNILIIDNIGMLFSLYSYAKIVYVGGGYGSGLHNILEPAAHGAPICFGPKYNNFVEATDMVNRKCAFKINDAEELIVLYEKLKEESFRNAVESDIKSYMQENKGASLRILKDLREKLN